MAGSNPVTPLRVRTLAEEFADTADQLGAMASRLDVNLLSLRGRCPGSPAWAAEGRRHALLSTLSLVQAAVEAVRRADVACGEAADMVARAAGQVRP